MSTNQEEEEDINSLIQKENKSLTDYEKDIIAKKILSLDDNYLNNNKNFIKELEFFQSNLDDDTNTLFHKINHTNTTLGKHMLSKILVNPTDNLSLLENRKKIINFWANNKELNNIINTLKQIKDSVAGDIIIGGKDPEQEGGSLHSSVFAAANTHQFNENDFDPDNMVFMQKSIENFKGFMQAGGSIPLEDLELLKQKTLTTQCRKYALNNKKDPLCMQFLDTIQDLRAFLKANM